MMLLQNLTANFEQHMQQFPDRVLSVNFRDASVNKRESNREFLKSHCNNDGSMRMCACVCEGKRERNRVIILELVQLCLTMKEQRGKRPGTVFPSPASNMKFNELISKKMINLLQCLKH